MAFLRSWDGLQASSFPVLPLLQCLLLSTFQLESLLVSGGSAVSTEGVFLGLWGLFGVSSIRPCVYAVSLPAPCPSFSQNLCVL